ncbi:MAG: hypothetical protein WA821_13435, partial [Anaerolineales bacterium]
WQTPSLSKILSYNVEYMQSTFRKFSQSFSPERAVIVALILLGVALRLRQYLALRSLWLDEAMLALNIVGRNFWGLLKPLDYNQGGPVGFLLLEKLVVTLLGNSELTLRLIPLLTGCASLLLFALLLRQALGKIGTFTALALFAAGAPSVYYASEVKQYASDVFVALLLLWLAGRIFIHEVHEKHEGLKTKSILLAIAGALAVWCSHPALFVLAGIGATLLLRDVARRDTRRLKGTLAMLAVWAASFAALYFVSLRGLAANAYLLDYWAAYFMPLPPWANVAWFPGALQGTLENPVGLGVFWLLPAALMLIGLISLLRRQRCPDGSSVAHRVEGRCPELVEGRCPELVEGWQFGALLALTLLAALAASGLREYPFVGRMILFAAPIFLALIGAGVETVAGWFRRPRWLGNVIAVVIAAFLLYQPLVTAAQNFASPKYSEHIRPTMAWLQANRRPGDVIYVYYWAVPAFRYYAPFYGLAENDFSAGNDHEDNSPGLLAEIDRYKGQKRVWVLFSHVYEKGDYNEKDALLAHLDAIGVRKREFIRPGTSVSLYLYDLAGK